MARMISKAKTSRVTRATTSAPPPDPSAYCRDLEDWPRSWMGLDKDLPPGGQLLAWFRPFRTSGFIESFAEDHSQACGQPVAAGRRNHSRPARRPFSEKGCDRPSAEPGNL